MFSARSCEVAHNTAVTTTDAGVAGAGVLLSFIITAAVSLLLSGIIIIYEGSRTNGEAKIFRKLLLSFSDQQILTGILIQSIGLAKMQTMVPYHFFIIWMLSLLSTTTHLATLLALVNDFKRDWVLRWLRQFLMFVKLVLTCISGFFVLMAVMRDLEPTLPMACVWELPSHSPSANAGTSIAGTIAVIVGNCVVFVFGVWLLHSQTRRCIKILQIVGLIILLASAAGAAIRVILLSQAFGNPSVTLSDNSERDWSFGQLLPLLLLLLPLVSAVEIYRGEISVPEPLSDDCAPLHYDEESKQQFQDPFQPNPFWGYSHQNLFKR